MRSTASIAIGALLTRASARQITEAFSWNEAPCLAEPNGSLRATR
jgi:hypothetical protein